MIARYVAVFFAISAMTGAALAGGAPKFSILGFGDLDGWAEDDHDAALAVFRNTCKDLGAPDWRTLCQVAGTGPRGRTFFELFFRPVLIEDDSPEALFTGYFEPELTGSRVRSARYRYPIYAMPPEARQTQPWLTRRQILTSDVLAGRGLEIAWVDDPVALFFLQVQGSGRVHLPNGDYLRVGYAGSNGRPYRSIGAELVRRGVFNAHQVSAQRIGRWVKDHPEQGRELLFHNDSYVFFREVSEVPAELGPLGAMNRSITAMRSIAVDPAYTMLGSPVWIEKGGQEPLHRLMIAQDTGSAIKGAQRADVFIGTGARAGRVAGRMKDPGRMVVLMPIQRAFALFPEAVQ